MPKCERCYNETNCTTGSWFNTQMICMDCAKEESKRKDYEEAKRIEHEEVKKGNYNFEGIGF